MASPNDIILTGQRSTRMSVDPMHISAGQPSSLKEVGGRQDGHFIQPPPIPTPNVMAHTKSLRRAPINDASVEPDEGCMMSTMSIPKSKETETLLLNALKSHFLFNRLEKPDISSVVRVMVSATFATGEKIITQGDSGNQFFVLEDGTCDIVVDGQVVGKYGRGNAFGELALMYNCPRAASIVAKTACRTWSVDRQTFRKIVATTASVAQGARMNFLGKVTLFKDLSKSQIQKIASCLKSERFKDGECIIKQGEIGEKFYIIVDGSVLCASNGPNDKMNELMTLDRGDYFGEMALLLNEPRQANCIARGMVQCLTMNRKKFTELLGPLRSILDQQMRIRVLRSVPLLSSLSDEELDTLSQKLRVKIFEDGDCIIREGDNGNNFYMINDGNVRVCKGSVEVMMMGPRDFFGERALLKNEPRAASCLAKGHVECLTLGRDAFESTLGKLDHIMEREMRKQQLMQEAVLGTQTSKLFPENNKSAEMYNIADCERIKVIGTGTFGRVYIVCHKPTGKCFALKCMEKSTVVSTHQQRNVIHEKNIILECNHPFILKLFGTSKDENQLYMLLEIVQGGELWTLLYEKAHLVPQGPLGAFDLKSTRFYAANIVDIFYYLAKLGIAYRDLKPENILIDDVGYLKLVDFGFAKHIPFYKGGQECQRSFTLCGTPEYLSPELVLSKGHNKTVDYWALGCLIYELMVGRTPFQDRQQSKIFEKIVHSNKYLKFPAGFNPAAKDLVLKLLHPNPALRLGALAGGMNDVVEHAFFSGADFDWEALRSKRMKAPFVPKIKGAMDTSNFDSYDETFNIAKYNGPDYFEGF